MFVDLRVLDDGSVLDADICIIGAGPAGIAIANEFSGGTARICLVESGDLKPDARNQDLADGEMVSHPEHDLRTSRDRQFGGCTNSWAGACAPMSRCVFEPRPWINLEGWPFSKSDLEACYERAQKLLGLGEYCYEPDHWAGGDLRFLDLDSKKLENRIWQLSPRMNFGKVYRAPFASSKTITVLLNATATEILTDEQASLARGVQVRSLNGKSATIKASLVVLACGAIDNARLLLLSRRHAPAGLGNGHDLVGRYFMQHPHVSAASLCTTGSKNWAKGYKDFRSGDHWLRTRIGLSEDAQRQHHCLDPVATLVNRYIADSLTHSQSIGYVSLKAILLDLQHGRVPVNAAAEMTKVVKDIKGIAIGLLRHLRNQNGALYIMSEQVPNPDSRVTLSSHLDPFGLEKACVDWRLLPIDKQSILALIEEIKSEFKRLRIGDVQPDDWLTVDDHTWPKSLAGGHHHMGTTRMSENSRKGVVDADARVHGTRNLYVAGSSIFPTVGCANPTLTLLATSLKLADHLKEQMAKLRTAPKVA